MEKYVWNKTQRIFPDSNNEYLMAKIKKKYFLFSQKISSNTEVKLYSVKNNSESFDNEYFSQHLV